MAITKSSLIYIPDISGFTKFVTETEIDHSTHIIEELLEIIIDSNEIDLEVSEIEGDAVLFYRFGEAPSVDEIVKQSKDMFIRFHEHLKLYERDRVCQCGACSTAQNLTLKMVAHYGELSEVKVRERSKLLGEDMIIAHRLLKNDVNNDEYLLLSGKYLNALKSAAELADQGWVDLKKGQSSYGEIGSVEYEYTVLTPLRKFVNEPPLRAAIARTSNPVVVSRSVKAPIKFLHEVVSDPDYKPKIGNIEIEQDETLVPRIGSKHICILPSGRLHFEAIESQIGEGHVEYGESAENLPILGEANIINILDRIDENTTQLTVELHYFPKTFIDKLKFQFLKPLLKIGAKKSFSALKNYTENNLPIS